LYLLHQCSQLLAILISNYTTERKLKELDEYLDIVFLKQLASEVCSHLCLMWYFQKT
jgi:hypothetical protein